MVSGFESLSRIHLISGRYRLGVRTGGSQPSNRGSNPRSATSDARDPRLRDGSFFSSSRRLQFAAQITHPDSDPIVPSLIGHEGSLFHKKVWFRIGRPLLPGVAVNRAGQADELE